MDQSQDKGTTKLLRVFKAKQRHQRQHKRGIWGVSGGTFDQHSKAVTCGKGGWSHRGGNAGGMASNVSLSLQLAQSVLLCRCRPPFPHFPSTPRAAPFSALACSCYP